MRLSYTEACLIVDDKSLRCHDVSAAMTTSRSSFPISSVLQHLLARLPGIATLAVSAMLCAAPSHAADLPVLKVGDQSLQTRGILEASGQLKDLPYKIEWFNFPAAQPLGEALNAGAVDVGGLGDAPLVFALAAGARVRAVAATRSTPLDLAIVVGEHSPLTDAASLKGKRIATTRGSIGHYLALAALKKADVPLADFLKRVAIGQRWALSHPDEVAAMQSRVTGLPTDVLKTVYQRGQVHPVAIDDSVVAAQQRTADTYEAANVIRAHLDVRTSFDRGFPLP